MTSEDYLACARFENTTDQKLPDSAQQMEPCDRVYHPDQTIRTSRKVARGFLFRKAQEFNMYLKSFLNKQNRTQTQRPHKWRPLVDAFSSNSTRNGTDVCSRPPSIGILSREKSRGIVNADQLADDLSEFRYVYRQNDATNNRSTIGEFVARLLVEVIFFEHLSFVEQVEFFRTDIVLSGHGAQLTGIPFMKTANVTGHCRQVLELSPFDYVLPYPFGLLTVGSGMSHSYVYNDDSLRQESPTLTPPSDPPSWPGPSPPCIPGRRRRDPGGPEDLAELPLLSPAGRSCGLRHSAHIRVVPVPRVLTNGLGRESTTGAGCSGGRSESAQATIPMVPSFVGP